MSNIIPTSGFVLIKPQKKESTTASGIVLTESKSEKPQQGLVISVGNEMITDYGIKKSAPCSVNDVVIYKEWGGKEVKDGTEDLLLMRFDDIMAIVK